MPKPCFRRSTLAGIALLAFCAAAHAREPPRAGRDQPPTDPSAPRIGLALSGGGARGLAHIGVIQVLDELRVPVHCVTGTSMGAVVGGIFASGVSPARMEEAVRRADWNRIFSDGPPRREMSMRRKADDYKHLFALELGVTDEGLALPKGVLAGVSIETFFRTLTGPAGDAIEFARLPIPFRAIAADIATGEAVVLDQGSVSRALRASMSVPGAVAPVEIGGRLLVDGGIVDNLPIEQARRLCADVVIAVNISTPPLKREEITSALSVSLQLVNLLGKATVEAQLESLGPRDVLITPELGDISAGSFERAAEAIRIGEAAARAAAAALARYSLPPQQYAALRSRQLRHAAALGTVDEIRFAGLERSNPEVLRSLVQSRPGEPLDEETIGADLRRIYGRGDFEGVDYRIVEEPGRRVLLIEPREKSWGPDYLRFGLGFATDFRSDNPFNVLASYRRTWLNRLGGEWLAEAQLGSDPRLFTEWFQPVHEAGRYFVAPYTSLGQSTRGVFVDEDRVAEYRIVDARLGVDVGASISTWGESRLGLLWRRIDANVETGSPVLPDVKETSAGVRARLLADRMDHAWFPRSGHRVILSALQATAALGSERSYRRVEAEASVVASWGAHTLNLNLAGGTDLGSSLPGYEVFSLGGPLRLSGLRIGELAGGQMRFARLMYYNRTLPLPDLLGSGIYVGASLEAGRVTRSLVGTPEEGTLVAGSLFLGASTFLGPAFLGLGYGEGGRASVYLLLGIP